MELQLGDKFLEGLNHVVNYITGPTGSKEPLPFQGLGELTGPNTYPESKLGQAGNYISAMAKHEVNPNEVEEFLRQYQFGNNMPGVSPQKDFWDNFLSKGNIGLEDIKNIGTKLGGLSAGAVIPPFLGDIMAAGNKPGT